jgi:non-heme chloroperoxidase
MNTISRTLLLLLLAMLSVSCTATGTAWTDKSPHQVGFIKVNGVRLHYLDWGGSGDTLLLLTGMGSTAHIYDDLAPKFTDRFHVLALTWRGQGESDKPETGYDTATLVDDIRQFLDALKIHRVSLVGHSLAGDELTMFAGKYPQRVEKLVYLDAAYDRSTQRFHAELGAVYLPFPKHDNNSWDASKAWSKKFFHVLTPAVEADLRAGYVLHDDGRLEDLIPARVYEALGKGIQPNPAYSEARAPALSFFADDLSQDLIPNENREKAKPLLAALVQWQTAERERFRKGMPHARIVVMPNTSHYCFIHREAEVVREMRAFLLEEPTSSGPDINLRRAVALGNSRPLPELFQTAGIKFDFSPEMIRPLVKAVSEELDRLK